MNKKGFCRQGRVVLVTVYVVKPRRKRRSSSSNHDCYKNKSTGSNRKSELLHYSQRLRASARQEKPPNPTVASTKNAQMTNNVDVIRRPVHCKPKIKKSLTWIGDWKAMLLPCFVSRPHHSSREDQKVEKKKMLNRSAGKKMEVMAKIISVHKEPVFIKKLLSIFQKRK